MSCKLAGYCRNIKIKQNRSTLALLTQSIFHRLICSLLQETLMKCYEKVTLSKSFISYCNFKDPRIRSLLYELLSTSEPLNVYKKLFILSSYHSFCFKLFLPCTGFISIYCAYSFYFALVLLIGHLLSALHCGSGFY